MTRRWSWKNWRKLFTVVRHARSSLSASQAASISASRLTGKAGAQHAEGVAAKRGNGFSPVGICDAEEADQGLHLVGGRPLALTGVDGRASPA